jgi:hypothetical protein
LEKTDHILAIAKASLSAIPFIGGSIASLVGDYIQSSSQKNEKKLIEILTSKISQVENRIKLDEINKDEFAELFKECYLITLKTSREEKIQACANILTNNLLEGKDQEKFTFDKLELFTKVLDRISFGSIKLLNTIVQLSKKKQNFGWEELKFASLLQELGYPNDIDPALILSFAGELASFKFIILKDESYLSPSYADHRIRLTESGKEFIDILSL